MNLDDQLTSSNNVNQAIKDLPSKNYLTIEEFLNKNVYPTLNLAINELVNHIKETDIFPTLVKQFNQNFFENKAKVIQKEKELLKLERGSDYSESDYDYFMRINMDMNESKSKNEISEKEEEEFDPDFDDSDLIHKAEQELDENDEENEEKFDPIIFLGNELKRLNPNKKSSINSISEGELQEF